MSSKYSAINSADLQTANVYKKGGIVAIGWFASINFGRGVVDKKKLYGRESISSLRIEVGKLRFFSEYICRIIQQCESLS